MLNRSKQVAHSIAGARPKTAIVEFYSLPLTGYCAYTQSDSCKRKMESVLKNWYVVFNNQSIRRINYVNQQ
jgi:hypothetical protein